jgi:hypothetical protein
MWCVEAYKGGRCVASFFVPASRSWWATDQLRELRESLVTVAMAIAEATTAEWVKAARRAERETALGSSGVQATEVGLSAAPTALAPSQGAPPVDPAARPLPSTSSANGDGVPQKKEFVA